MTLRDQEEQDLRLAWLEKQMNKAELDMIRTQQEMKLEPWKLMGIAFGAGAAFMGAVVGLLTFLITFILRHG